MTLQTQMLIKLGLRKISPNFFLSCSYYNVIIIAWESENAQNAFKLFLCKNALKAHVRVKGESDTQV